MSVADADAFLVPMNTTRRILDSLTAHISLYHSRIPRSNSIGESHYRSAVIRWFSSLSVHQRRSHLTIFDPNFVEIVLQMMQKINSCGAGRFILLPDLPQNDNSALPTICYRKSEGLLLRFSEFNNSERVIRDSVELFSSGEVGRKENENASLQFDAMTVGEDLVADVNRFIEVMDEVSGGEFLRGGEEGEFAGEWVELGWLKAKGYYTLEEFIGNSMEVALKLAWLSRSSGKKKGLKLKERLNAAGAAANLFWRKKGCIDWWEKLDGHVKKKVFFAYLGKAANLLIVDIVNSKDCIWDGIMCSDWLDKRRIRCNSSRLCRRDIATFESTDSKVKWNANLVQVSRNTFSLDFTFKRLHILQVISSKLYESEADENGKRKLFFSSLDSVNSISDIIFRKFRELLMVVSIDCTKIELLREGTVNSTERKLDEKYSASHRKKKGKNRNKKASSVLKCSQDVPKPVVPTEDKGNVSSHSPGKDADQPRKFDGKAPEMEKHLGNLLREDIMDPVRGVANGKIRNVRRKNRTERKRPKSCSSNGTDGINCHSRVVSYESASLPLNNTVIGMDKLDFNPNSCSHESTSTIAQRELMSHSDDTGGNHCSKNDQNSKNSDQDGVEICRDCSLNIDLDSCSSPIKPMDCNGHACSIVNGHSDKSLIKTDNLGNPTNMIEADGKHYPRREAATLSFLGPEPTSSQSYISYEWPSLVPIHPSANTHLPTATDRLHLDVGHNWKNHFHRSFVSTVQVGNSPPIENAYSGIMYRPMPMSSDWPLAIRGVNRPVPSVTCNYDSEFIPRRRLTFQHGFTTQSVQCNAATSDDERTISGEQMDVLDVMNSQEMIEEHERHWMSEDELEAHAVSGMDYNQYFGGGVMYWNPSDHPGSSFSRPPSLCSDDGSWAWREADLTKSVDDMVAFSSSYSTNGLTSPSTASFCSPFDSLGPGALGYVIPSSDLSNKMLHSSSKMTDAAEEGVSGSVTSISGDGEKKALDSLPYPILRPIIIPNISRERSRSDFKRSFKHKSPCVHPNNREQPWIKRPPSPVVLCAPQAPRPPPPSPVGDSRKHRGFPTVRSGSSSPRHWGVKGWFHDGVNFEDTCAPIDVSEIVWPSWRSKTISSLQLTQPLAGTLLHDRLIAISQLARDQEHPDVAFPLLPPESQICSTRKASLSLIHDILHNEINSFCKQVASENLIRKPFISWAVKRVARSLQVLWPRARTNVFGSNSTGLSLPSSDVDLVVCLPPVRNLEPIKEAGILEGRNGIKETCLQHAARYLANQEWVKSDSLKIVENTAIPIIMLVVEVPQDLIPSSLSKVQMPQEADCVANADDKIFQGDAGSDSSISSNWCKARNVEDGGKSVRLDISFKSPTHTGLQTTGLVKDLADRFPAVTPLTLVLKQFLADRSLDQSYSGGLSSYCLILLITRFLQHEHHHGRPTNQNHGSLLMDFLYFFGNVFDPRQMCISVQGSGVYLNRERGCSIDPLYIVDPLFLSNNVGRNCFRIHQCIKAFADAYTMLENELTCLSDDGDGNSKAPYHLLPKIIPSISHLVGS